MNKKLSMAQFSGQSTPNPQPWQDREVGTGTKLLMFFVIIVLVFMLPMLVAPLSMIQNSGLQTVVSLTALVGSFYLLYRLWRSFIAAPTRFVPAGQAYPSDKLDSPFDVKFGSSFSRTFAGKGILRFKEKGIEVNGTLPPSIGFQLGVIALVTIVPLVVFKIGLGIIPALLIAQFFGKEETNAWLPYERLSLKIKGRSAVLKHPESTPRHISFRLGTDDGRRFYRELQAHFPQALMQHGALFEHASTAEQPSTLVVTAVPINKPIGQLDATSSVTPVRIYLEKDNLGTRHDTLSKAQVYWMSRIMSPIKDPFVLGVFDSAADAKKALLEIPCIKIAADSGALICTEVLTFGYYPDERGGYEAILCGDDLTIATWELTKAAMLRNNGRIKNDLKPTRLADPPLNTQSSSIGTVIFDTEMVKRNGGTTYTYRYYKGSTSAAAKAFLEKTPVTERCFYVIVETPEGTYGRDIDGMYKQ